jgi:hypothetical protein
MPRSASSASTSFCSPTAFVVSAGMTGPKPCPRLAQPIERFDAASWSPAASAFDGAPNSSPLRLQLLRGHVV